MSLLVAVAIAASSPVFTERPCPDARLAPLARCGIVEVPEDRDRRSGRTIALNVVVLPASSPGPHLPPLFDIDGGPGLPATKNVGFYLTDGAAYRARRDIVLVDQRGTGGSNPLACPELDDAPETAYREMLPPAAVARCRVELAARADLALYGTREAVADLDAVRAALGHERLDIFALSYGTTVALRYMSAFPRRVRAAVLMGAAPPDAMPPRHHATAGQRALDLLFQDCAADEACRAAFPSPSADLDSALARLRQGSGLSPEVFTEKLRSLIYSPIGARRIPWILRRAAQGDMAPFHQATAPRGPDLYADGMFLSVTCSESFALMDYDSAAELARATRFGDYRLRRQREACRHWAYGQASPDHLAPVVTEAAVLLISGRLDPVTPPEWAEALSASLPNARHFIVRHGGHLLDGLAGAETCLDPLLLRFYETGNAAGLDGSCLGTLEPPPFVTSG